MLAVVRLNGWRHVDVRCLPAALHNTPRQIAGAVEATLAELAPRYDRLFVAYADCGTVGALDRVLERHGAERLPGAHCYAAFAGLDEWDALQEEEPGTLYLTDFLARHFESLVVRPLGLDRYPELAPEIFGNYRRLVYLSQTDDPELLERARAAAERLGLELEHRPTGYGRLASSLARFAGAPVTMTLRREGAMDGSPQGRRSRQYGSYWRDRGRRVGPSSAAARLKASS